MSLKSPNKMPLMEKGPQKQKGASLIAAIFVITALAALGGLMTQLLVLESEQSINEWYSAQALYAAESGVDWAAYQIESGAYGTACPYSSGSQDVVSNQAWFSVQVTACDVDIGGQRLYRIESTGTAGGTTGNPRAQRRITVQYMP
jgi:hypothetical protein